MNLQGTHAVAAFCESHLDTDRLKTALLDYLDAGRNRWTPQRKVAALTVVRSKLLSLEEFCQEYDVGLSEFASWAREFDARGLEGLMATRARSSRGAVN